MTMVSSSERYRRRRSHVAQNEPNLDRMAHVVQNLFKFKNFYYQMTFSSDHKLTITKAIIELTNPSECPGLGEEEGRQVLG